MKTNNFEINKLKLFGGITGAIIIGIIPNAIWDGVKIFSSTLYKATLYVSTLGIESFKNKIYLQIAKGFHEGISVELYLLINFFLILVAIYCVLILFLLRNWKEQNIVQKVLIINR